MNTSNAFRSHLMQQFLSQARTQSRPPLALLGIYSDENEAQLNALQSGTLSPSVVFSRSSLSSINSTTTFTSNVRRRHTDSEIIQSTKTGHCEISKPRLFSTVHIGEDEAYDPKENSSADESSEIGNSLAGAFQNMILTRRSSSRLVPLKKLPPLYEHEQDFWIDALDRAVQCGQQAPNHKRTEPFTFKRMIAVSEATERLADIAYHVDLRQRMSGEEEGGEDSASPSSSSPALANALQHAQLKREKWARIPAFLVTTVTEESHMQELDYSLNEYDQLPYQPPHSERALEDYASACAAVQNVLLSLHSEQISTKWVTGPVIRTLAFRDLVNLESNDRVVALIMVGAPQEAKSPTRAHRRNRRVVQGDLLVDL